ncbi:MAG TPA: TrmJ/YjtD family RNA methyltransferase [Terriglobales bacterium]|jgi:TrmH family RNA methyltransferase|nr:TrmJ/YjtD family RNA methyltransferase [Terriglobales bacterium]
MAKKKRANNVDRIRLMDNLRVVLVEARNPLNIGAAARAMSNFGVPRLRVVNPYEVAFREARSAVGAAELLAKAEQFEDVGAAVADCRLVVGTSAVGPRELQHSLKRLEAGGRAIRRGLAEGPVALLFGSERFGLSNLEMSHCHWMMRIPTREEHGSMNLGQAVAVCLYELIRGREMARAAAGSSAIAKKKKLLATSGEFERLTTVLLEVLRASGYVKPRIIAAEEKLRRLVRRMELNDNDAEVLLGMLRQVAWKLGVEPNVKPNNDK